MTALPRPEVAAPGPWSFPTPESFTLGNGLSVLVYQHPGQHVIAAGLSLELPLSAEDPAREGVAALTASCVDQGTRSHPGTTFLDAVEGCGAILDSSIDYSATEFYLDVPAGHLREALPLLAEAVIEPELTDADVARERTLTLAHLEQQQANGSWRADHALRGALIDPRYRSSRHRAGEPDTVALVSPEDARAFHRSWYAPEQGTLVLVGDLPGDLAGWVEEAFGSWTNTAVVSASENPAPQRRRAILVDRPGAVQADIRMGRFTTDRTDPRWPDFQIAQNALGGAFLSRLNTVLREERGYTYGIRLGSAPLRHSGFTAASGSFRTEVVADAVALIPELLDVRAKPLTATEIEDARTYLTGVQPLHYATASGVCHGVMTLLAAGLSSDFVDQTRAAYARVTPESATVAAAELLPPEDLSLVVVGDATALSEKLAQRGFEVEVVPDGH